MKRILLYAAAAGVLAFYAGTVKADIVRIGATNALSFVSDTGVGFGAAPRVLTMQTNGSENGSVAPDGLGGTAVSGDAIAGANKASSPTLQSLNWSSGDRVFIDFNTDQTGNSGATLQSLTLNIFNGTSIVASFSTASPINYSVADLALQQGNGHDGFIFKLDDAQRTIFDGLGVQGSWTIGLASIIGCPTGSPMSCNPSNDGPDSYTALGSLSPGTFCTGGTCTSAVPLPGALPMFVSGMGGLWLLMRRKRKLAM